MALLEKIRDEIIETQKIQADFTRWKLLLIAAVGAAGLGVTPVAVGRNAAVLLVLLPFVCLYADALVYNSGVRVLATAQWLREESEPALPEFSMLSRYEEFLKAHRKHFDLEVIALVCTSVSVSVIVAFIGVASRWPNGGPGGAQARNFVQASRGEALWLFVSGSVGVLLAVALYLRHRRKVAFFDL